MSALPPKADIGLSAAGCPLSAINGREQLKRGRCADQGDRDQSTLMFAARMTLAHFSVVSVRSFA